MSEGSIEARPPPPASDATTALRPRCSLVGAGPGDPDLLTIKALKAIEAATVLLVDDLVSADVVSLAKPGTRVVHVGKRGGCKSTPQAFIEKLMIAEALKGERVVRLKGGDPFVFGRGGEEAQTLRRHGIEVEIVNGITSGLAAAASLGAPLTHRDCAHGVVFVTGHASADGAPPDWHSLAALASGGMTLVVYMGVAEAPRLQTGLLAALSADTPVAVVQNASRRDERRVVATLATLVETIALHRLGSPAVIIVGDVLRTVAACEAPAVRAA
jgi:uroporphyrin-III C-methyltransferase